MGMIVAHKIRNLIIFNHNAFLAKKKMLQNQNNNKKRVLFSKVCITNFNFPYIFQRKKKEKKNLNSHVHMDNKIFTSSSIPSPHILSIQYIYKKKVIY